MTDPIWARVNAIEWEAEPDFGSEAEHSIGRVAGIAAIPDEYADGGYRIFAFHLPGLPDDVMEHLDQQMRRRMYEFYAHGPLAAEMKPFTTPSGVQAWGGDMVVVYDSEFEAPHHIPDDWT
jgi:hypothetical protein